MTRRFYGIFFIIFCCGMTQNAYAQEVEQSQNQPVTEVSEQSSDQIHPPSSTPTNNEPMSVVPIQIEIQLRCPAGICQFSSSGQPPAISVVPTQQTPSPSQTTSSSQTEQRAEPTQPEVTQTQPDDRWVQPEVAQQPAREAPQFHNDPAPIGGINLAHKRRSLHLDFGFPYLDLGLSYGIHPAVQMGIGYQGLYSLSSSGYGQLKFRFYESPSQMVSLSFTLNGGFQHIRSEYYRSISGFVGGTGAFGELLLNASIRKRRNIMFIAIGSRISHVMSQACNNDSPEEHTYGYDYDSCDSYLMYGQSFILAMGIAELGWSIRFMQYGSFFIASGVNLYFNSNLIPVMVRFRTGLVFDF